MVSKEFNAATAEAALSLLGAVLAARGQQYEIAVIGGTCLLLSRITDRVTRDVDVVARVVAGEIMRADVLPAELQQAAVDVAHQLDLPSNWLNSGPAGMTEGGGLPAGFMERVETRAYGGLTVHLAGRQDMIAFKVYAAADHFGDAANKHVGDLLTLAPTSSELVSAAAWCRDQDPSPGFGGLLEATLADLERRRAE